jgi:hypothetical protein
MHSVEERLVRLEQSNRRLRLVCCVSILLFSLTMLVGADKKAPTKFAKLQVEELVIGGQNGTGSAVLRSDKDGFLFNILDKNGKEAVILSCSETVGSMFALGTPGSKAEIVLLTSKRRDGSIGPGEARIGLTSSDGNMSALLFTRPEGKSGIGFVDAAGKPRVTLGTNGTELIKIIE